MATTSKTSSKAVATAGSSQLGPSKPATSSSSSSTAANKALQQSLNAKGANLKVDGIIGPLTQAAQAQFGGSSQKTAQFGDKGQYTYNVDAKGNPFGNPIKTTSTIATTDMKTPATPLPTYNMPNIDGKGIVTGIQNSYFNQDGTLRENVNPLTVNQQNTGNIMQDYFTQLIDANNNRQSQAELYREAQKETDILNKQKAVSDLSGQLQQITAQGQANQLSVVGQGRGIPEAIIGGQQAQFARETAIQALPVAASLSAAQGNLEMANNNLNTLFSIKSADAKADYEFKTNLITSLRDYATKQEDKQLDYVLKLQDRQYQETQALNAQAQAYAKMAFENNQSTLGSKIASLDYKSPTFKTDLAKLQSQIYDPVKALDADLKRVQIAKVKAETPTVNGEGLKKLDDTMYSKFTTNPNYKSIQDGGKFYKALDTFEKATEKWGTAERLNAKGRGELNSAYMSLVALTKDYYTLGTLDAGVEKLVSLGIPKPGTYSTRDKIVLSSIDTSKKQVLSSINNSANQLKNSVYGDSIEFQSLLNESLPSEKDSTEEYTNNVKEALGGATNAYVQAGYLTTEE